MVRNSSLLILFVLSVISSGCTSRPHPLRQKLEKHIRSRKADIGIAVMHLENGDTLSVHGSQHFPMQSVYKFHLALAVLNQVDKGKFTLAQKIHLGQEDMQAGTWSPLRDKYPEGDVDVPLSELLAYAVSQSDNNGCDVLFRLMGGPDSVNAYIHSLGVQDVSIVATEEEMHEKWEVQYINWCTPNAAVQLLRKFYAGDILSPASREFLYKLMVETTTGPDRIKKLLPRGTVVAHKTGTGGAHSEDNEMDVMMPATNDIGIVTLPDGKHLAIAVFVSNSKEGYNPKARNAEEISKKENEATEKIIAETAKMIWDYFTVKSY